MHGKSGQLQHKLSTSRWEKGSSNCSHFANGCTMKRRTLNRFFRDDRGNFSAMFALSLVPVVGLIGMAVDFTVSSKRKAILDAIADSASLAAVTPAMLAQGDSASIAAATNL